jgi:hypothetical protein
MLTTWRAFRSAFLTWSVCGIAAVIGLFVLNPVYINICEAAKNGTGQKCEPYNALYFAAQKFSQILLHAETWILLTALATIAIAVFTYTLKKATDQLRFEGESQRKLSRTPPKRSCGLTSFPESRGSLACLTAVKLK